jgi:5'-3' exonuclease
MTQERFLHVDYENLMHRARHAPKGTPEEISSTAVRIILVSILRALENYSPTRLVIACETRSWRKDVYEPYKKNRILRLQEKTSAELETERLLSQAMERILEFFRCFTNACVVEAEGAEADDVIAVIVRDNPDAEHRIYSSDKDLWQLVAPNVSVYDVVGERVIRVDGIFDLKTLKKKEDFPPTELFILEKIFRGDPSDNILPAFPRLRRSKIVEAYQDSTGIVLNNILGTTFMNHNKQPVSVRDQYLLNRKLIDFRNIPEEIVQSIKSAYALSGPSKKTNADMQLLRFIKIIRDLEIDFSFSRIDNLLRILRSLKRPTE